MTGRVLFMARDAGAAAALVPVVHSVVAEGRHGAAVVAAGKAVGVFERAAVPVLAFPEDPSTEDVKRLIEREEAVLVVTGTSMKPDHDARFWAAAAARGLRSVAVLDHWCNYAERFSHAAPFDRLPDAVAVMDEAAAGALRSVGAPAERLRITGQPYFDALAHDRAHLRRETVRRELGVDLDRPLVVFASEPQARYYGDALGYDEHDSLAAVLAAVGEVAPDAAVVVKLHPLEPPEAFHDIAGPHVRLLRACPPGPLIVAADVVAGMTSVFLLESAVLGVPTLSVRPGGREDHYLSVHRDLIASVTDPGQVAPALAAALARTGAAASEPGFGVDAVARTVALIGELAATPVGA